ncbi:MAG: acyl-CoA dehydrogenase [Burkholderiales bacterium]|nr:acyl-CoA dehydrogenase [Burkholderiales bacterium]
MDFDYTEEQQLLADSVEKFLEKTYTPEMRTLIVGSREGFGPAAWQGMAELGLLGVPVPTEHGGFGGGGVETALVMEAFGRHLVVEPWIPTCVMAATLVAAAGTADQKHEILTLLQAGRLKLACAFTEPGGRYALDHVTTTARQDGDFWVIDGAKSVVMHGDCADLFIVAARTSGDATSPHGISLFFVNPGEDGVSGQEYPLYDETRAVDVRFDNVRVGIINLIGVRDEALGLIELAVDRAIAALCAEAVGCMDRLHALTLDYLRTRQQFGMPIGRFQALQHRAVDMLMHLEQARSMALLAAMRVDATDPVARRRAVSAAKELIGRAGRFVGQQAIQLHGGIGMTDEYIAGRYVKRLAAIDTWFGDADHHLDRFHAAGAAQPPVLLPTAPRSKWKTL